MLFHSSAILVGSCLTTILLPLVSANFPPQDVWNGMNWNDFFSTAIHERTNPNSRSHRRVLQEGISEPILADSFGGEAGFYHGVASGDPLEDRVVLWTKYTPVSVDESIVLELRIAEVTGSISFDDHLDPKENPYLWTTNIEITAEADFIAKVDVTGLDSNTHFVYAFTDGSVVSDVGQTRTAPSPDDGVEELIYAFYSCADFGNGYFHPYDVGSTITGLDFWIHLGDYIYEYGASTRESNVPERQNIALPEWELLDLQDYRNRYAVHHRYDEGLRNLRRRAPVIATWDDHEFANNAYGSGSGPTGAQNHQEECDPTAGINETNFGSSCDRDEGNASERFTMAAQAYMEWMPIRQGTLGGEGVVEITSITQIIEWGNLATVVAVDTRLTGRSKEPTVTDTFSKFVDVAMNETDVASYYNLSSPARQKIDQAAMAVRANLTNPEYSILGESLRNVVLDAFEESKEAGKPWQIFAQPVVMGPQMAVNFDKLSDFAPESQKSIIDTFVQFGYASESGFFLRALVAMAITNTPLNSDSWDGFSHERGLLLDGIQEKASNPIIIGGDSHDSWVYTLFEGGAMEGDPVAVNFNCPPVTSSGYGAVVGPLLQPIAGFVGGIENAFAIVEASLTANNEGLLYSEIFRKGFVAVKATKDKHVAEYILFEPEVILADYDTATSESGNLTASFSCDASFATIAGQPGSVERQEECQIGFDTERPDVWNLPTPIAEKGPLTLRNTAISDCNFSACEFDASMLPRPPASIACTIASVSALVMQVSFLLMII